MKRPDDGMFALRGDVAFIEQKALIMGGTVLPSVGKAVHFGHVVKP